MDGNGFIDVKEIMHHLQVKNGLDEDEANQLTEEIMANLDEN